MCWIEDWNVKPVCLNHIQEQGWNQKRKSQLQRRKTSDWLCQLEAVCLSLSSAGQLSCPNGQLQWGQVQVWMGSLRRKGACRVTHYYCQTGVMSPTRMNSSLATSSVNNYICEQYWDVCAMSLWTLCKPRHSRSILMGSTCSVYEDSAQEEGWKTWCFHASCGLVLINSFTH